MTWKEKSFGFVFTALLTVFLAAMVSGCGDMSSGYTRAAWKHPLPAADAATSTASKTVEAAKTSVRDFVTPTVNDCVCQRGNAWRTSAAVCRAPAQNGSKTAG